MWKYFSDKMSALVDWMKSLLGLKPSNWSDATIDYRINPDPASIKKELDERNNKAIKNGDKEICSCTVFDLAGKLLVTRPDTRLSACQGFSDDHGNEYITNCKQ